MLGISRKLLSLNVVYVFFLCAITEGIFAAEDIPSSTTVLENSECIQCHQKQNNSLIKKWQNSAHASTDPVVDCVSCHGKLHKDMVINSRRDETCIECHGGKKDPVVHSYSSSKHGTLMQLEKNSYDWSRTFELANYRAPGCGYCHMHQSNHDVSATVRHDLMNDQGIEEVQDETRAVCQDCHSPRYITDLFTNGESMLEIARKKVRETEDIIKQAANSFTDAELMPAKIQFKKMQKHLRNVYLGIGHQSPDYQWWHGQPALDGDLLRIKDSIGELYRLKK
jgi:hypothetical protein